MINDFIKDIIFFNFSRKIYAKFIVVYNAINVYMILLYIILNLKNIENRTRVIQKSGYLMNGGRVSMTPPLPPILYSSIIITPFYTHQS